ncbi:MAG: hypothetical protein HeimC3_05630 [Candidatus Heimdallarchaeota archaeon LC_3]|nr:MAG: hypothetical protein HeimC3_05630 [Candidatus Heimdallarchaeota archaeon LC_3]
MIILVSIISNDDSHKIQCPYGRDVLFSGKTEIENQIDKLHRERDLLENERKN